jgi:hypothetical protein
MLTFKQFISEQLIILENRIDFIKNLFKNISTEHDPLGQHKDSDSIVDHFATNADPTINKVHTEWIMNRYKEGSIKQEDHPRIRDILTKFKSPAIKNELKSSGRPTDINRYRSLSSLETAIQPYAEVKSGKEEKREIKSEGADLVHDDKDFGVTVHHIKTKEASCSYGAGTKWCTTGTKDNKFDELKWEGPIHIIQHQGRKYQFQTATREFKDERNVNVSFEDLHPDIPKSLAQSNRLEISKLNLYFGNPHYTLSSDTAGKLLYDPDYKVRMEVAKHPEHAEKLVNDKHYMVRMEVAKHPEHAEKLVNDASLSVRDQAKWTLDNINHK